MLFVLPRQRPDFWRRLERTFSRHGHRPGTVRRAEDPSLPRPHDAALHFRKLTLVHTPVFGRATAGRNGRGTDLPVTLGAGAANGKDVRPQTRTLKEGGVSLLTYPGIRRDAGLGIPLRAAAAPHDVRRQGRIRCPQRARVDLRCGKNRRDQHPPSSPASHAYPFASSFRATRIISLSDRSASPS